MVGGGGGSWRIIYQRSAMVQYMLLRDLRTSMSSSSNSNLRFCGTTGSGCESDCESARTVLSDEAHLKRGYCAIDDNISLI